jgi:hypothetical protein
MLQSAWSVVEMTVQVPELDSRAMKTTQILLEVLSLYWIPLRRLVRSDSTIRAACISSTVTPI